MLQSARLAAAAVVPSRTRQALMLSRWCPSLLRLRLRKLASLSVPSRKQAPTPLLQRLRYVAVWHRSVLSCTRPRALLLPCADLAFVQPVVDMACDKATLAAPAPAAEATQEQVCCSPLPDFVRGSHLLPSSPAQLLRQLSAAAAVPLPSLPAKSPAAPPAPPRATPPAAADHSPASQGNAVQVDSQVRASATVTTPVMQPC